MLDDFFNCVVDIEFMEEAPKQTSGGFTPIWSQVAAGVRCRIEDASSDVKEEFARQQLDVSHTVFTTYAGLTNRNRLVASGEPASITWRIQPGGVKHRRAIGSMPNFYVLGAIQMVETGD